MYGSGGGGIADKRSDAPLVRIVAGVGTAAPSPWGQSRSAGCKLRTEKGAAATEAPPLKLCVDACCNSWRLAILPTIISLGTLDVNGGAAFPLDP